MSVPSAASPKHFIDLDGFDTATLRHILKDGVSYKKGDIDPAKQQPLSGKTLAMIFEKPSTRTRVSFDVAMRKLGGETVVLSSNELQTGRGETLADTARVLSRYVDAIMMRTYQPWKLHEMAAYATIPVINGLTDSSHPCQLMADVMTYEEHRGAIAGRVVAWSGDGNNVASSWVHAAVRFNFELKLACPEMLMPPEALLRWARDQGGRVSVTHDPAAAVKGADCVVTDTWVSMDRDATKGETRHNLLAPYRVDDRLMGLAKPDAVFMHCLPAHRGEEVTASVLDGPQSLVWDEAENRLHVQKAILAWCLA
ncbi:MAG: ornithine carbamoyltransferase [Proteobacteria bacterium]|nr:ornithine carbamoyltransferase [Pseudomonadota bacterium]MBI3498384.1 ornithine carbamoyltransferase [Pseudomonadota bacterium]